MKELTADITMMAYMYGSTKKAYLTGYKKNSVFLLNDIDISFKIVDIDQESITIDFNEENDRFRIIDNKINIKNEIKIFDICNKSISISIRLDNINEK